jgi:hypothetical protein
MHNRKLEIVQGLVPLVPKEYQQNVESAMQTWWANLRRNGGMRLTDQGYKIMHHVLKLESWELDLTSSDRVQLSKSTILAMDRKLEWPYYLDVNIKRKRRHVIFFGSREAMMAVLYRDLESFLENLI